MLSGYFSSLKETATRKVNVLKMRLEKTDRILVFYFSGCGNLSDIKPSLVVKDVAYSHL